MLVRVLTFPFRLPIALILFAVSLICFILYAVLNISSVLITMIGSKVMMIFMLAFFCYIISLLIMGKAELGEIAPVGGFVLLIIGTCTFLSSFLIRLCFMFIQAAGKCVEYGLRVILW